MFAKDILTSTNNKQQLLIRFVGYCNFMCWSVCLSMFASISDCLTFELIYQQPESQTIGNVLRRVQQTAMSNLHSGTISIKFAKIF